MHKNIIAFLVAVPLMSGGVEALLSCLPKRFYLMRLSHLCLLILLLNAPFGLAEISGCYETPNGELFTVFPSGSKKNTYRVWNITNGLISRLTPDKNDAYFWKDDNSNRSSTVMIDGSHSCSMKHCG